MPRLSVYFTRMALANLAVAFSLGGLLLANKGVLISPYIWKLLPLHVEMTLAGGLVQLAVGVAFWILPRFSGAAPRGDERLSWAALVLLNAGIGAAVLAVLFTAPWLALAGRVMEAAGLAAFALGNWKRVKPMF